MNKKISLIRFLVIVSVLVTPALSYAATEGHALDWTGFYYRVFIFVLFVIILAIFLRKPILKLLKGRSSDIETAINNATLTKLDAERMLKSYQAKMVALDTELETMRNEALALAEKDAKDMIAEAHEAAEKMKLQSISMMENQLAKAKDDLRNEVTLLALEQAKKAVIKDSKGIKGKKIMDAYIKRIGA